MSKRKNHWSCLSDGSFFKNISLRAYGFVLINVKKEKRREKRK